VRLPVVWLPEAKAELREARDWYDALRPELGERFALSVEAAVNDLTDDPLHFAVVHRGRRRAGIRRFPYAIIFEVQEQQILVIACFHSKRNPKHRRER
jgi:plasmid stabilization system protein ParE